MTLKIGTRVRYSDERLHRIRTRTSGFNYTHGPERVRAQAYLDQEAAFRGEVIGVIEGGYRIRWDASPPYTHPFISSTAAWYVQEAT